MDVAALPLCQGDCAQGLPVSGTLAEQGVRFQPQLPMPVVSLTVPLHFNSSKAALILDVRAIQHQPHFGPGPLGEQTAHQWYVAAILSHRLIG